MGSDVEMHVDMLMRMHDSPFSFSTLLMRMHVDMLMRMRDSPVSSVQSVRESDILPYVLRDPRSATLNCALASARGVRGRGVRGRGSGGGRGAGERG